MTISSTANKIQYTGNGVTTSFSFAYVFFSQADLLVTLYDTSAIADVAPNPILNGAGTYDYVITGTFDPDTGEYTAGGNVVFNTAPPSNYRITIERIVSPTQLIALIDGSRFPASTVNGEMDKLTVLIQRNAQLIAQALSYPSSDTPTVTNLIPAALERASKFLAFDGNGNPIAVADAGTGGGLSIDLSGGTGGNPALVMAAGLNLTMTIPTLLPGGGPTTIPVDMNWTINEFDVGGLSDYRAIRNISEFVNSSSHNYSADKFYGQYQGLKLSGTGTGTVNTTYNYHGFTWLNGPTNIAHLRGIFHHIPLEGAGSIIDAIDFEAGTNVYTSTGTIVSMTGFQTSGIGGAQVHTVIGFRSTDTTADTTTAFTITSGTYDNATGVIVLTVSQLVTVGLLQNVVLSGLTGTGAFASLNGTWATRATTGFHTISLTATAALGVSTITGGTATVPLGGVVSFLSEQTGVNNFAFKSTGNAAVLFTGAQIQVGNVTWQGTQTTMSQDYTLSRAMGAVAGVNTGLTHQTTFSASNTNADARGFSITVLPSGSTAITNVIGNAIAITSSATATITQMTGTLTSLTLQAANNVTTARASRSLFQLSSSGGITTAVGYLVDAPVLTSTGAIATAEGFTASQIGHATLVTNAKGFRMLDTSAVTLVEAFAGEVQSGTGKWNISITGSANNRVAGSTSFGKTTAPNSTIDIASGGVLRLGNNATTGLVAGVLAGTTNASIVISDQSGQAYRIPCII